MEDKFVLQKEEEEFIQAARNLDAQVTKFNKAMPNVDKEIKFTLSACSCFIIVIGIYFTIGTISLLYNTHLLFRNIYVGN